jgi:hypothetical protein
MCFTAPTRANVCGCERFAIERSGAKAAARASLLLANFFHFALNNGLQEADERIY